VSARQATSQSGRATAAPALAEQIADLDESLFSFIEPQVIDWDQRALLALHTATAEKLGHFAYLEVGSYLGSSLQVVMRDPRCSHVISLDPRPEFSPDNRGAAWVYDGNTKRQMLELLADLPDVDMSKLSTFDAGTDAVTTSALPVRPDLAFVDGEHTDEAALRDARFCAEALQAGGVIAFHDYTIVGEAIRQFVQDEWTEISFALAFTGNVFAVELGGSGILRLAVIDRAVRSSWHSLTWRLVNRPKRTAAPFLLAWSLMPVIDGAVAHAKRRFHTRA
jgi:Methyltransferase domain